MGPPSPSQPKTYDFLLCQRPCDPTRRGLLASGVFRRAVVTSDAGLLAYRRTWVKERPPAGATPGATENDQVASGETRLERLPLMTKQSAAGAAYGGIQYEPKTEFCAEVLKRFVDHDRRRRIREDRSSDRRGRPSSIDAESFAQKPAWLQQSDMCAAAPRAFKCAD